MTRALIVVDVQNDFVEGGSLAVKGGLLVAHRIANGLNALEKSDLYDYVVATKDYHNPLPDDNGGHFGDPPDFDNTWPVHCVAGTEGSEFAEPIEQVRHIFDAVFYKGQGKPSYSGFEGRESKTRDLLYTWLLSRGVGTVDVSGLATEFCVRRTAVDSRYIGFNTRIIPGWCAAVGGPEAHNKVIREVNGIG